MPIPATPARPLNWDDLRMIAALSETGSLTGGARTLGVNHSTIYRRLGALEERLGTRLYERRRDGLQPTPAGEQAASLALRLKQDITDLDRRLTGLDDRLEGVLTLTTTDTLVDAASPLIAGFRKRYPGVTVELLVSNEFANLSRRDCDIALRASNTPPDTLIGRRLGVLRWSIFAHGPEAADPETSPGARDWIGFDAALDHLAGARWLKQHVPADRIVIRANTLNAMRALLAQGAGTAVLPEFLGEELSGVARIGAPLDGLTTDLWLLTHADIRNTGRVRAFMDHAHENWHMPAPSAPMTPHIE